MLIEKAVELFLASCRGRGLAETTVQWYGINIRALFRWMEREGVSGSDWLCPEIVEQFLASERAQRSPATVAARYRALRPFFGWLQERGHLGDQPSPMLHVAQPRVPRRRPRQASEREIRHLLRSIPQGSWMDCRDRLAIRILELCGLRAAELCGLHIADIDCGEELLFVRNGKGGDARAVPVLPEICQAYTAYLLVRPPWSGPELLLGADGSQQNPANPLTTSGLRAMLKRRCQAAGLDYLNPHSFRHGLAVRLLNRGADMSLVQAILGHSRITTTQQHYAAWTTDGLKSVFRAAMGRQSD